jgi:hypothetical protein
MEEFEDTGISLYSLRLEKAKRPSPSNPSTSKEHKFEVP